MKNPPGYLSTFLTWGDPSVASLLQDDDGFIALLSQLGAFIPADEVVAFVMLSGVEASVVKVLLLISTTLNLTKTSFD